MKFLNITIGFLISIYSLLSPAADGKYSCVTYVSWWNSEAFIVEGDVGSKGGSLVRCTVEMENNKKVFTCIQRGSVLAPKNPAKFKTDFGAPIIFEGLFDRDGDLNDPPDSGSLKCTYSRE